MLSIPLTRELQAVIAASPTGHLTLLTTSMAEARRRTTSAEQFRRVVRRTPGSEALRLPRFTRRQPPTTRAEAGCAVHEIAHHHGHVSIKEVERYTKERRSGALGHAPLWRSRQNKARLKCQRGPSQVSKPSKALTKN